eukprot:COSAG06_NODE_27207_length_598_cov_0.835671_1_plen_109_part_00
MIGGFDLQIPYHTIPDQIRSDQTRTHYTIASIIVAEKAIVMTGRKGVPFPLFKVLDGRTTEDYLQRVEPSPAGGKKMAEALFATALGEGDTATATMAAATMRPATMER